MLTFFKDNMKERFHLGSQGHYLKDWRRLFSNQLLLCISVVAMSYFKLRKPTYDNLVSLVETNHCRLNEDKRKIHCISWEKLCLPKQLGEMYFKYIHLLNQVLSAKHVSRLMRDHECHFSRFLKNRYCGEVFFEKALLGFCPFFGCKSILFGKKNF